MMLPEDTRPLISPVLGDEVAQEVLQWIGVFRALRAAMIVSFNMQDYDFWGYGRLSTLLLRQLAYGAEVTLLTTPPPGSGSGRAFKDKLELLEELNRNGVKIFLNDQLHAKAYLFSEDVDSTMTIVGSANLTGAGFGRRNAPERNLLELCLLTSDNEVHKATNDVIAKRLIADAGTLAFETWRPLNMEKIARARGAP